MKILLSILLLTSSLCISQTGFIEIEVRDTIQLKPIKFEYNVQISDSKFLRFNEKGGVSKDSSKVLLKEKYKELGTFLKNKKYEIRPSTNANYQIHDYIGFWKYGYVITLEQASDLQKLTSELKELDYITGSLGQMEYANEEKAEERLFKKLLDKARKKASTIAKLSDLKLGKIIEFHEVREVDNMAYNMLDMYAVAQRNKKWQSGNNELYGQKSKAIVVKFLAE
ncbi:SIMPL domain-containing protein [Aureibaculum conchae]|uniref:SIMPL domain-containing protein n=1 Tax=Aureibaculum sp. 2308TA14-22 TaxID=3108392 RepID=UPI003391F044